MCYTYSPWLWSMLSFTEFTPICQCPVLGKGLGWWLHTPGANGQVLDRTEFCLKAVGQCLRFKWRNPGVEFAFLWWCGCGGSIKVIRELDSLVGVAGHFLEDAVVLKGSTRRMRVWTMPDSWCTFQHCCSPCPIPNPMPILIINCINL